MTDVKQISLPGINRKQYAYDALLKDNPTPNNTKEAEVFFRKHTDTLIKLKEDIDYIRVVLKGEDEGADKQKREYSKELSIHDMKERDKQFVELAAKVHADWLELEEPKYRQ